MEEEAMTREERIEAATNLKEADRVPCDPFNIYIHGYQGGISLKEYIEDPYKQVMATEIARKKIGEGDQVYPNTGTWENNMFPFIPAKRYKDQFTVCWVMSDDWPPKGNIPNFFEKLIIEDYDDVMERGFSTILYNKKIGKQAFERSIDELLNAFEYAKVFPGLWREFVERNEVPLMIGGGCTTGLDILQLFQGYPYMVRKIYEDPEKVKEFLDWHMETDVIYGMRQAALMGAGEVPGADKIMMSNGGPPGITPDIFQDIFWPSTKKAIDTLVKRGFRVHLHWDNDLTPHLEYMKNLTKGLPKGKIILDLEKTNMAKAKEILGDRLCLYGNLPTTLLIYGTVNKVKEYCKKLIEECGSGGGYILSTECETPWDAKPELVRAMLDAAKEYGKYK